VLLNYQEPLQLCDLRSLFVCPSVCLPVTAIRHETVEMRAGKLVSCFEAITKWARCSAIKVVRRDYVGGGGAGGRGDFLLTKGRVADRTERNLKCVARSSEYNRSISKHNKACLENWKAQLSTE